MMFKAAFPAVVMAKPPRRPSVTKCLVRREVDLELPEIDVQDAPHVMTVSGNYLREVKDWGGPVPVRLFGGRYYRPLMTVDSFKEALTTPLMVTRMHRVNPLAIQDIYEPLREKAVADMHSYRGRHVRFWPTDVEHMLRHASAPDHFFEAYNRFCSGTGSVPLDDDAMRQVDDYRDFLIKGFDDYAIIDGAVWKETLEPVYCVRTNSLVCVTFPETLDPTPYRSPDLMEFGYADHFFAADQREVALEFLDSHSAKAGSVLSLLNSTKDNIEVHDQSALGKADLIHMSLYATALCLYKKVGAPTFPHTDKGHAAVRTLASAIEASNVKGQLSEDLESAVIGILDLEREQLNFFTRAFERNEVDQIRLQLSRQEDRDFVVPITRNMSP